jgi:resuscitation-promoting factor RpfA
MAIVAGAAASIPLTQGTALAGPPGGWGPIIQCESGGNPKAQNPDSSASGLLQFISASWIGYHGTDFARKASLASPAQQLIVAERAYARDSLNPWASSKACWGSRVAAAAKHAAPAPKPAPVRSAMYTVRPGDSLSSIAQAHGTTWQALFAANKNKIRNPRLILPGLLLNLPKG